MSAEAPPRENAFLEALHRWLAERRAGERGVAIVLVDCRSLERVDAVWGYPAGDALRSRMARQARAKVLRPGDALVEMDRDEFACLLADVDDPAVAMLAAEKTLREIGAPVWLGDEEIHPGPAIGIALSRAHGERAEDLLRRAKVACTAAVALPRRIAAYSEELEQDATARLMQENRLHSAVAADTYGMLFQPQYDLRHGLIIGAETVLVLDGSLAAIAPVELFAAADTVGLVGELTASVLNRALRNCSEFRYSGGLDLRICVNLPARALLHAAVPDIVERSLRTWGMRAGRLIVEISETRLLASHAQARETLGRLSEIGVKPSIDDRDLSLSSLFLLGGLPFRELKIQVPASLGAPADSRGDYVLKSFIDLAHGLKLDATAVGAGDENAAARLVEMGCDYLQADFKGPALEPAGFVERYGFAY